MDMANDPRVQLLAELADETRFAVLERLEQGPASASELSELLHVAPTRLANHLRRLRDAGLVTVSHHGRLAIYQLAEPGLREIFSMLNGLRGAPPRTGGRVPAGATCYDHLAGWLGVVLLDHLVRSGALQAREGEGELGLGPAAADVFTDLGVELPGTRPRRMLAFSCMDSHAGRPHLGGQLGAQLATSLRQRGWVEPAGRPRRLRVTPAGSTALGRLGIETPIRASPVERAPGRELCFLPSVDISEVLRTEPVGFPPGRGHEPTHRRFRALVRRLPRPAALIFGDPRAGSVFEAPGPRPGTFPAPCAGRCGMLPRPPCPASRGGVLGSIRPAPEERSPYRPA